MDRIIDAKLLKPELEKSKQEIKLPDIPSTPNPELEEFEAFKQSQTASDETHKILVQTVSKLSEKDVSYNLNFNDEAKKVKVDISYLGDKEGVDKAKAAAADYATFLQTTYYNEPKGNLTISSGTNEFTFVAYPLLAGDITGPNGTADNKVDGLDYAMVKAEFAKDSNRNLKADLDYSCDISGNDINLVKVALNERQSQRY